MRRPVLLGVLLLLSSCSHQDAPPWKLLELGDGLIQDALEQGQWVLAESNLGTGWLSPDPSIEGQILTRDLKSLPDIACGDRLCLHLPDFPMSLRDRLGWPDKDSLTVTWTCLDMTGLAAYHQGAMRQRPFDQVQIEEQWFNLLTLAEPDSHLPGNSVIQLGETVEWTISTLRADGVVLNPNPVILQFQWGEEDQLVPALEPLLPHVLRGSEAVIWSRSSDAFGSEAHPDLELPPHMPLRFTVKVK